MQTCGISNSLDHTEDDLFLRQIKRVNYTVNDIMSDENFEVKSNSSSNESEYKVN